MVENESYFVKDIYILSTAVTKGDGTVAYIPNPWLAQRPIFNFRRAGNMWDSVSITVPFSIEDATIQLISERMDAFFKENPVEYTGPNGIDYSEVVDNYKLIITFWYESRGNFQNTGLKGQRKIRAMNKIREIVKELDIQYRSMPQTIKLQE